MVYRVVKANRVSRNYVEFQINCTLCAWLLLGDTFYSVGPPVSAPPASFASPRCTAAPLALPVSLRQFIRRTSPCQAPSTHTHPSTDSCSTDQTTMAVRDAASLLVGLLLLCHTWGGEWPRNVWYCATRGFGQLLVGCPCIFMSRHITETIWNRFVMLRVWFGNSFCLAPSWKWNF